MFFCCLHTSHRLARMSCSARCLTRHRLHSPSLSTPTSYPLLFPSNRPTTCTPPAGLFFGRFAEQSPLTGYQPSAPVEVSSTEVPPTLLPSKNGSIGSTCTATTSLLSWLYRRKLKDRTWECWPHNSCHRRERETSANPFRNLSLQQRKF